jgi:hypothetical protein
MNDNACAEFGEARRFIAQSGEDALAEPPWELLTLPWWSKSSAMAKGGMKMFWVIAFATMVEYAISL